MIRPNGSVTFSCLAWSFSVLLYKWIRNDSTNLPSNNSISFQDRPFPAVANCLTTVYELTIMNVHEKDEDLYCCVASNECGTSKECAWLEVDSKLLATS